MSWATVATLEAQLRTLPLSARVRLVNDAEGYPCLQVLSPGRTIEPATVLKMLRFFGDSNEHVDNPEAADLHSFTVVNKFPKPKRKRA